MNSAHPTVNQRQAALALHALNDADRAWLLEQLPVSHRAVLAPLLAELRELGLPGQTERLQATSLRAHGDNSRWGDSIAHHLAPEPARLVGRLIREDWPGREAIRQSIGADRCAEVLKLAGPLVAAPALARELQRSVTELPHDPDPHSKSAARPRLKRWSLGRGKA